MKLTKYLDPIDTGGVKILLPQTGLARKPVFVAMVGCIPSEQNLVPLAHSRPTT